MRSRAVVLVLVCALGGCLESDANVCATGVICASGLTCHASRPTCVSTAQVVACEGREDDAACIEMSGHCVAGACLPIICGDGLTEGPDEQCDDGNHRGGDGCSATCRSDETCGNGFADVAIGELCDDGNTTDHDGCAFTCTLETPQWTRSTAIPAARTGTAVAYDSTREVLVVFGGHLDTVSGINVPTNEILEWDGAIWQVRDPATGPSARTNAGAAYDRARGRVLVFGGVTQQPQPQRRNDTWEWDGAAWTLREAPGPSPRGQPAMAYDTRRARVVLFGGSQLTTSYVTYGDTWEWDGETWTERILSSHPPASDSGAMAYDEVRGVVVAFVNGETWEYDGLAWTRRAVTGVGARIDARMSYDPGTQRVVLFGGSNQSDMHAWNGTQWTPINSPSPPYSRSNATFGVDRFGRYLVSGGTKIDDLVAPLAEEPFDSASWLFEDGDWRVADWPEVRSGPAIANDPAHDRVLVVGGEYEFNVNDRGPLADTWSFTRKGWRIVTSAPLASPPARANAGLGCLPGGTCLLVGGDADGMLVLRHLWTLNGDTWSELTAVGAPSPRTLIATTVDTLRARVVVFGGRTALSTSFLAETWTWNGSAWTEITTSPAPPARRSAALGYDYERDQVVLFGGADAVGPRGDTWVLEGDAWREIANVQTPRVGATLAWNPARRTLVLAGGDSAELGALEWTGNGWQAATTPSPVERRGFAGSSSSLDGGATTMWFGRSAPMVSSAVEDAWTLRWE